MPPLVFLHEGLGSLGLWRGFPDAVRETLGGPRTIVYSRPGYGRSTPLPPPWPATYMHDQALTVLPALLARLGVERPVLVGHSDGASIGLIHAGAGHPVAGLVLLAPHVFVEERTLSGIRATCHTYETTDMADRMRAHHDDAGATFRGWSEAWLAPAFRHWNIEACLPGVSAPVLVVQGAEDRYGTVAQVAAIERGVAAPVRTAVLDGVGHSPHVEAEDETLALVASFVSGCGCRAT